METSIIVSVVLILLSLACYMISGLQFGQKGFLFNNAYLFASKEEREKMNKRPHYIQSGIVFALLATFFLLEGIDIRLQTSWIRYVVIAMVICAVVFAIVSSIIIEKNKK